MKCYEKNLPMVRKGRFGTKSKKKYCKLSNKNIINEKRKTKRTLLGILPSIGFSKHPWVSPKYRSAFPDNRFKTWWVIVHGVSHKNNAGGHLRDNHRSPASRTDSVRIIGLPQTVVFIRIRNMELFITKQITKVTIIIPVVFNRTYITAFYLSGSILQVPFLWFNPFIHHCY